MTNRGLINKEMHRRMLEEDPVECRVCGVPLITRAEALIGVHIACVQTMNNRPSTNVPSPRYGTQRRPNAIPERKP